MASNFFRELRRRRVVSRAVAYAILAWIVAFGLEAIFVMSGLPVWMVQLVRALAILGLPLTIYLVWTRNAPPPPSPKTAAPRMETRLAPAGTSEPAEPSEVAEAEKRDTAPPSAAVLPFTDDTADGDAWPFADGFTAELSDLLATGEGLRVAPQVACFAVKGRHRDYKALSEKLHVGYILEGSVSEADGGLAVRARLLDASTGQELWSESYDQTMEEIFAILDDIVWHAGDKMEKLLHPGASRHAKTTDFRAYASYLRGRGYFIAGSITDLAHAVRLFSEAVEIDPNFVLGWNDLAATYALQVIYFEGSDAERKAAHDASQRAVELAPDWGEAHLSRGVAHLASADYDAAATEFERAIELDPTLWEAYYNYGRARIHQGQMAQAVELLEKAAAANTSDYQGPLLAAPIYKAMGNQEAFEKCAREGIARAERWLADYPMNHRAYYLGAGALLDLGERERAFEWAEKALAIDPSDPSIRYNMGCFYAKAGEVDKAFDCLRDSITSRSWAENDPDLEKIREDPRYQAFLDTLQ